MDTWSPVYQFCARFAFAGAAAACTLLLSKRTLTLRQVLGETGRGCLFGGAFSPLMNSITPNVLDITKAERITGWAVAIGSGVVTVPMLRVYLQRMLGGSPSERSEGDK